MHDRAASRNPADGIPAVVGTAAFFVNFLKNAYIFLHIINKTFQPFLQVSAVYGSGSTFRYCRIRSLGHARNPFRIISQAHRLRRRNSGERGRSG
ncbi:hypothetical protein B2D07_07215 [Desulfococcus multivorans]|nr:hypothetical protein B2D07_07215 [Desulfococcus multivorans]